MALVKQGKAVHCEFTKTDQAWVLNTLIPDMVAAQNGINSCAVRRLSSKLVFTDTGEIVSWDLSGLRLIRLPTSFKGITVKGDLNLSDNAVEEIPEGFFVKVGGRLSLR